MKRFAVPQKTRAMLGLLGIFLSLAGCNPKTPQQPPMDNTDEKQQAEASGQQPEDLPAGPSASEKQTERFDYIGPYVENRAVVEKDGKYGYVDKGKNIAVSLIYEDAQSFSQGLGGVKKEGLWGFVDPQGNVAIPFQFDIATSFSEGLAAFRQNYQWGFIDKKGEVAIRPSFDFAFPFEKKRARVQIGMDWWLINPQGEKVERLPEPTL